MLAATLSPSYGIYSGYEHFENVPVRAGREEYLDSEKYEIKQRALDGPLLPMIRRAQRDPPREPGAAGAVATSRFLDTANDALIAYAKQRRATRSSASSTSTRTSAQEGVVDRARPPRPAAQRSPSTTC